MTLDEAISGLKQGRTLVCDRKDEPLLPTLLQMAADGILDDEFVEYDEQSSAIKFRWKKEKSI